MAGLASYARVGVLARSSREVPCGVVGEREMDTERSRRCRCRGFFSLYLVGLARGVGLESHSGGHGAVAPP